MDQLNQDQNSIAADDSVLFQELNLIGRRTQANSNRARQLLRNQNDYYDDFSEQSDVFKGPKAQIQSSDEQHHYYQNLNLGSNNCQQNQRIQNRFNRQSSRSVIDEDRSFDSNQCYSYQSQSYNQDTSYRSQAQNFRQNNLQQGLNLRLNSSQQQQSLNFNRSQENRSNSYQSFSNNYQDRTHSFYSSVNQTQQRQQRGRIDHNDSLSYSQTIEVSRERQRSIEHEGQGQGQGKNQQSCMRLQKPQHKIERQNSVEKDISDGDIEFLLQELDSQDNHRNNRAQINLQNRAPDRQSNQDEDERPEQLLEDEINYLNQYLESVDQNQDNKEVEDLKRQFPFVCLECPKGFTDLSKFQEHMTDKHFALALKLGIAKYLCKICMQKAFQKKHHFFAHLISCYCSKNKIQLTSQQILKLKVADQLRNYNKYDLKRTVRKLNID